MKFEALGFLDVSLARLILAGLVVSVASASAFGFAFGRVLGSASFEFVVMAAVIVFYLVVSTPRRIVETRRMSQSQEATSLAVAASACLSVTGSRTRTFFAMRSRDRDLEAALGEARKLLLLGTRAEQAARIAAGRIVAYSAVNVLRVAATMRSSSPSELGEEREGLTSRDQLARETQSPVFMTVAFFSPIMLLLYSLFAHFTSAQDLAEVVAMQVVVLDLAFHLCSRGRNRGN